MKLTLRIENFDFLPDGGPLEFSATARGCEVGRDSAMDWTLPDPGRHISSRHFEVVYRDRQFWLNDISTNGTFVYGQSMRVSSPLALSHNERLQVGQYIIRVLIGDPAQPMAQAFAPPQTPAVAQDPWSLTPTPAPMPTAMPAPNRPAMPLAGQFGDSFIENARPAPVPATAPPAMPAMSPPAPLPLGSAALRPAAEPFVSKPQPMPPAPPVVGAPAAVAPSPPPVTAPSASADVGAAQLLDAICKGAGLPAGSLTGADLGALGEDIGRCLRIATEELMALLGARAAAKQFVKSASRTMIGGMNNSPLKFKPNTTEALLTMFVQRNESYLSSTASFQQGFEDIKRHQTAVYAAMQPALARLLENLSPESIEERATGGIMSSKKARAWETYVERWDSKTHPHENGMLDVFLSYFADAYDDAVKKTGG
jgi:type VI secretion system protein ImpI